MKSIIERLEQKDWHFLKEELNTKGFVNIQNVINEKECVSLMEEFNAEFRYRKTVVMERYRFGKGVYKYFTYPLPEIVETLRRSVYPYLAPVANKWMEVLKIKKYYPATLAEFLQQCKDNGQEKAAALVLGYGPGGWCAMHQDLYGEVYFPMQMLIFLDDIDQDYTGGEFILTENIPMAQSRTHVLKPKKGDLMIFTTDFRPQLGAKGYYRIKMKHGVATIHSGERHTLGIIFHDAKS